MFATCEGCHLEPDHYACDQCGGEIDFMLLSGFSYGEPNTLNRLEFAGAPSTISNELNPEDWVPLMTLKFEHRIPLRSFYVHTLFVADNGITWVHLFLFRSEKPTAFDHANADVFMTLELVGKGTEHPVARVTYIHS